MADLENLSTVTLETPYGKSVTLRRSMVASKKDWNYICSRFGLAAYDPEKVVSIKIEGQTDFDRLTITAVIEKHKAPIDNDRVEEYMGYGEE